MNPSSSTPIDNLDTQDKPNSLILMVPIMSQVPNERKRANSFAAEPSRIATNKPRDCLRDNTLKHLESSSSSGSINSPEHLLEPSSASNRPDSEDELDAFSQNARPGSDQAEFNPNLSFFRWCPEKQSRLSITEALMAACNEPLTATDQKSGYIYVYSLESISPEISKLRKIGSTERPVKERVTLWNRKCKHRTKMTYPIDESILVPHVRRLESIIHAELKDYRGRLEGCACGMTHHREWFDAPDDLILAVIDKWTEWMLRYPYKGDADKSREAGYYLKETWDALVKDCQPTVVPRPGMFSQVYLPGEHY